MPDDLARAEHHRFLIELLETTQRTVARQTARIEQADREDLETLHLIARELAKIAHDLAPPPPPPQLATAIHFTQENPMLPVEAGYTLIYTGTLSPAGSILAPDFVATVTSNDPAILPAVDPTGLVVTVPLPAGWVESTTTPLTIAYGTASASTGQALSATIVPGAEVIPPVLATSISFAQTT
jgi:hypothetical protein